MSITLNSLPEQTVYTQAIENHDTARSSKFQPLIQKDKDRLRGINSVDQDAISALGKLFIDPNAASHIKVPIADHGHKEVNSKRVLTNLGASVFSMMFKTPNLNNLKQAPVLQQNFLNLIEQIEKHMYQIVAMPSNENELHEDMRKHKKFLQEAMDELEHLEKYFGILRLSQSAIINFKKLRPVILEMDASGERY